MYYSTNALLEHIRKNNIPGFIAPSRNTWQLLYGNSTTPKLLVLLVGLEHSLSEVKEYNLKLFNKKDLQVMRTLSSRKETNLLLVAFSIKDEEISEVLLGNINGYFEKVTMQQLAERFKEEGLNIKNTKTQKYLNDKTSSAYHNWQRDSLGSSITVVDFDLWGLDSSGNIRCFYELKRSRVSLSRWEPYKDDFANFKMVLNFLSDTSIDFKIAYNFYDKEVEDINNIKVFKMFLNQRGEVSYVHEKTAELSDFCANI